MVPFFAYRVKLPGHFACVVLSPGLVNLGSNSSLLWETGPFSMSEEAQSGDTALPEGWACNVSLVIDLGFTQERA